jgi:hypothetical protein
MDTKVVIGCVPCDAKQRPSHAKLASCENCNRMVWVSNIHIKKKRETDLPLWCAHCITSFANETECKVETLSMDEDDMDSAKESSDQGFSGVNEESSDQSYWPTDGIIPDEIWEQLDEKMKKKEERCFIRTKANLDQQKANLEKVLPSLCHLYMSRLNPFASFEDLSICISLSTMCESILVNRRDALGPQHLWQGWDHKEIMTIFRFIVGVTKAVSQYRKDSSNHMDNLNMNLWVDGLNKWREQDDDSDPDSDE